MAGHIFRTKAGGCFVVTIENVEAAEAFLVMYKGVKGPFDIRPAPEETITALQMGTHQIMLWHPDPAATKSETAPPN